MNPNINSGLGSLMANSLIDQTSVDTTGRFFIVGASALAIMSEIKAMYQSYPDGTAVVYPTVKLALAACVASRGDVVFVVPGHTESITNTTDLNVNVIGVTILGLGTGSLRPTFTLTTATTAIITFSAANCQFLNCIVDGTGFAGVVSPITVTAANVVFRRNLFINANATNQAGVVILTTAAANGLTIDSNYFQGSTDAGTTNALQLIGGNDIVITNNVFYGAYTTSLGAINNITTACLRMTIANNFIFNQTASSTKCIVLVSTSTGVIANNRMQILSGTAPITGAAMAWVGGNYYAATIATAGTLI